MYSLDSSEITLYDNMFSQSLSPEQMTDKNNDTSQLLRTRLNRIENEIRFKNLNIFYLLSAERILSNNKENLYNDTRDDNIIGIYELIKLLILEINMHNDRNTKGKIITSRMR